MDLPEEFKTREAQLTKIAATKAEIERRAAERYETERCGYEKKMAEREEKASRNNRRPGGKLQSPPTPGASDTDQMNFTDPESLIMPKSGGAFEQAYNGRHIVDVDSGLIVGEHVSQNSNDKKELEPALAELAKESETAGQAENLDADNGYYSEDNVKACEKAVIVPRI
jgi:hypothetical protein